MLAMGMAGQAHTSIDITSLCGHVYGFPKKRLLSIQHQRREIGGILGDSKTPLPLTRSAEKNPLSFKVLIYLHTFHISSLPRQTINNDLRTYDM